MLWLVPGSESRSEPSLIARSRFVIEWPGELNLILCPAVDGAKGAPSVFDSTDAEADRRAPVTAMTMESSQALEGGAMLLRYRIQNADIQAATGR